MSKSVSVESLLAVFTSARKVSGEKGAPKIKYAYDREAKKLVVTVASSSLALKMLAGPEEGLWEFTGPGRGSQYTAAKLFAWMWRIFESVDSDLFKDDLEKADLAFKQHMAKFYGMEAAK